MVSLKSRYCHHCQKTLRVCICGFIKPISHRTELLILQHHSEGKKALATAQILALSLEKCRLLIGENFSDDAEFNLWLKQPNTQTYVLYPDKMAIDVRQISSPQHLADNSTTASTTDNANDSLQQSQVQSTQIRLIIIDGTWKKAYKMLKLSTNLHALPTVSLPKDAKGNYRLRKAPNDNALSTVEAGFYALQAIEPETSFAPLLEAFAQMIDQQAQCIPAEVLASNYPSLQ